ncbi:hypothetical protein K437DRAFT_206134, partial [Tilletiaria anomala UBC 951]
RAYSTGPNQYQVFQSFGTPLGYFFRTIARTARIITLSGLTIALVTLGIFEGTHQYVEHISMPRAIAHAAEAVERGEDECGWEEDYLDDASWAARGISGTDSRLSTKARHAVRAAWIAINLGGGLSPTLLSVGAPDGSTEKEVARIRLREAAQSGDMNIDNGLRLAEGYLDVALKEAERQGMRVPDSIALGSMSAQQVSAAVDPTSAALETQLADARVRIGTPQSMSLAIEGYERLFNAFGWLDDEAKRKCGVTTQRMVRLASRIGALYQGLGQRGEAENWYMRGISLIPSTAAGTKEDADVRIEAAAKNGSSSTATPSLTRALVSSLLGLSSLYATPPQGDSSRLEVDRTFRASLEKALGIQTSALRMICFELQRLSMPASSAAQPEGKNIETHPSLALPASPSTSGSAEAAALLAINPLHYRLHPDASASKELYWLWALHHGGQASLHIAETIYAL